MTHTFFTMMVLCVAWVAAVPAGVRIESAIGDVIIVSADGVTQQKAKTGMRVREGFSIHTGLESGAQIRIGNGTVLRMDENSVVTVQGAQLVPADSTIRVLRKDKP